jgi:NAD(P)H dehydrogenase (quinone)
MADILVLYYSRNGATETLAREVCKGVDAVEGMSARLRTVPTVSAVTEAIEAAVPDSGPPYATNSDLAECAGLIMGSPSVGKPAGVFASTGSLHGGQETTLLSMAIPLLHHGMIVVGLPYTEEALSTTTSGGTPYGPTHVTWNRKPDSLSDEEKQLAQALGKRVADLARRLED